MCDGVCPQPSHICPFCPVDTLSFVALPPTPNCSALSTLKEDEIRLEMREGDHGISGLLVFSLCCAAPLLAHTLRDYSADLRFLLSLFAPFLFFLFLLLFSTFTIAFPSFISTPFITPMVQKVILTFTALCCLLPSSLAAPTQRAPLNGHFLHLTDIHPDAFYLQGSTVASSCHSLSNLTSTVDIPKSEGGYFGTPDSICDTPFSLVNATFDWIDKHLEPVDFVVWTGDNARYGTGFSFSLTSFPPLFFFPLICRGN